MLGSESRLESRLGPLDRGEVRVVHKSDGERQKARITGELRMGKELIVLDE